MTIKIIAKNTGFSIATVSRVINGNTKVNSEIREKILNEIKRLDYKPNIQAQNLVLKKNIKPPVYKKTLYAPILL